MTNREKLCELSAEAFLDKIKWLIFTYGKQFDNSDMAIIEWLNSGAVEFDCETQAWFDQNPGAATTVEQCKECGLFYKPSLGHECEVKGDKEWQDSTCLRMSN